MRIDEAIGILQFNGAPGEGPTISDFIKARSLGVEALYRLKRDRVRGYIRQNDSLPGETS